MPSNAFHGVYHSLFSAQFFVADQQDPYFQEKLLQVIWNEQLTQPNLTTADGRRLEVIHPGVWNVEAGPDFHHAVVAVDGQLRRGAVEVHLRPEDWERHGHDGNPDYADVVLHVVWHDPRNHGTHPSGTPLCLLEPQLGMPLPRIVERVDLALYPYARKVAPGGCAEELARFSDHRLQALLQSYGIARMMQKAEQAAISIETSGLDQCVYALLCDVLGYKNNRQSFRQLAELAPLEALAGLDAATMEAVLFGAAGLLPDPSRDPVLAAHRSWVRGMWDRWWDQRRHYRVMHWNRHRQRPLNAPERRLLALIHLLRRHRCKPGAAMVSLFREHQQPTRLRNAFRKAFEVPAPAGLENFYDFARELQRPAALLGTGRADDLLVNVGVPLFVADALLHQDTPACARARDLLLALPKLQDNRLLKEAVSHFFVPPSRSRSVIRGACAQQGLIQLYRDFHLSA